MIRLHVAHALVAHVSFAPASEQARYLVVVMRQVDGDEIVVFNGRDGEWVARLVDVSRKGCRLEPIRQRRPQPPAADLELLVPLVKRARLEIIVEKAVELGVGRIRLITTRRTNDDHARMQRLQAIAVEAAEQTGRLDVPPIDPPTPLEQHLADWPDGRRLMFCDEAGDDPSAEWGGPLGRARPALEALRARDRVAWSILVGPEGGFETSERARLRAFDWVTPVTLGPRILRADTAALSALTLWQATQGDWGVG